MGVALIQFLMTYIHITVTHLYGYLVHSTYANIFKKIYKKVKKIVGIGWIG